MILIARMAFVGSNVTPERVKKGDVWQDTGNSVTNASFIGFDDQGKPTFKTYRVEDEDAKKLDLLGVYTVYIDNTSGKDREFMRLKKIGKKVFTADPAFVKKFADACNMLDTDV